MPHAAPVRAPRDRAEPTLGSWRSLLRAASAVAARATTEPKNLDLCGLLEGLCKALVEHEEAAEAVERGAWMANLADGALSDTVLWTPQGRTVGHANDLWPRVLARKERARRDLDRALANVHEAAGEDLDLSLVDSLCERVRVEAEAQRVVGSMEDYAGGHGGGVSNESYRRAQEDLDRAIRARETAQTEILACAEEHPRAAPPRPVPRPQASRPRAPRRSARSRSGAAPSTPATADSDPPASGDPPPPGLSPAALLAALHAADPATLAEIRDALGDVPRPRFVPSESQRALWAYLLASPVARSLDLLALDLRRAKRTVLRDFRVLEARGIVRRVEGGGLLVAPLDGNQRGTRGELTGAPSSGSVVSR